MFALLALTMTAAHTRAASPATGLQWFAFPGINAVSGVHNSSVKRVNSIKTEALCMAAADAHNATIYTWHDATTGSYAHACILRTDSVWSVDTQLHHFSGIKAGTRPLGPHPKPPPPTPAPPMAAPPCSLNGALQGLGGGVAPSSPGTGTCACDPGWVGPTCGQLDLLPAMPLAQQVTPSAALALDNAEANATWGMSVIGPVQGVYHGYMTEIANECMLGEYGEASQVVHMAAASPLGPWRRVGVALAGFAHNPQAHLTPNGSVVLFHIGADEGLECLADCRGTPPAGANPHPSKPRPPHCTHLPHAASVAFAHSPFGPFKRYPYPFGTGASTNPTAVLLPNDTIIVALRRATSATQPLAIGHVDNLAGPWRRIDGTVHATAAGSPHMYEEDPFMYRTARGWHMLTRRKVAPTPTPSGVVRGARLCPRACTTPTGCFSPCPDASDPDGLCGGGHLYSLDLNNWFFGEAVYSHSPAADAQCNVALRSPGSAARFEDTGTRMMRFTSRQRPTLFTDQDGSRYLFNGASVNRTMYYHSFTFVQQINTTPSARPK